MKGLKIFLTLIGITFAINSFTQQNFTLYNMPAIPQFTYTNPAFIPDNKMYIGLPIISSIYLSGCNTGFAYSDLVKKRDDDSIYLDVDNLISKLSENNYLKLGFQADLFHFGIKFKKNYLSVHVTEKIDFSFRYPRDFIDFAWNGNGGSMGEKINFNLGIDASHYREYGIGFSRILNEQLTVGGKLKYLYGMENVQSKIIDVSLTTDSATFDITARSNIEVNTSGFDSTSTQNFDVGTYLFKRKNTGFGIDLGGVYTLNKKFSFSASLIDLGFITWKSGVTNFVSKNTDANFTFKGFELDLFSNDSTSNSDSLISHTIDSIADIFEINQTHNSYKTWLSTQIYIGGKYIIHPKFNLGALLYGRVFDGRLDPGFSLSANVKISPALNASVSYSIMNRSTNNVGFGIVLTGSPALQLYLVTDNILAAFYPENTKNFNVRVGINLALGKAENKEEEMNTEEQNIRPPSYLEQEEEKKIEEEKEKEPEEEKP